MRKITKGLGFNIIILPADQDLDALGAEPGEGLLPQTPGADHPARRRVPGDRSRSRNATGRVITQCVIYATGKL